MTSLTLKLSQDYSSNRNNYLKDVMNMTSRPGANGNNASPQKNYNDPVTSVRQSIERVDIINSEYYVGESLAATLRHRFKDPI
jgi:hypothetical protein